MLGTARSIAACLLFTISTTCAVAGKPAIFQPEMPANWTWQQRELANKALDVLFDTCPAITQYMADIRAYDMHVGDISKPVDAQSAPKIWKAYEWSRVLRLDLVPSDHPSTALMKSAIGQFGGAITFYMGAGTNPGIWMQTSAFPETLCGAKHTMPVRDTVSPSGLPGEAPDTFIPVPKLQFLDAF